MATTQNFTVNAAGWTRIASGRGNGQVVKVEGAGPFVVAVTVGKATEVPGIPALTGHRVEVSTDLPLVNNQHLWATASVSTQLTVT